MGMLSPNRLLLKQERRHRRRIQACNGLIASAPRKKNLLYQEDDRPRGGERSKYSGPNLPEDILCHIHSLMPLRDSARSACVSCTFLHSWRCYPKLTLTEKALGLTQKDGQKNIRMGFTSRVDRILENHSGSGVKILKLVIPNYCNVNTGHLNNWLQNAITPGIEEVSLLLPTNHWEEYSFPCSILHNGCGNSIRFLHLTYCSFRPMVGFDCLRSLTKLDLYKVRITGDELGFLISNSFALEQLKLGVCNELMCIKIPFWLERLSYLSVAWCENLQVIESRAPKLSTFNLFGDPVQLSLGTQVKKLNVGLSYKPNIISYAITKLPSIVPHLETLTISSMNERINAPMVADKFLHLKYLKIFLYISYRFPPAYDYLSLVSFLYASPLLETFILSIKHLCDMKHDSVSGDASHMRQIPEHKHDGLKKVQINGFFSAKSMVELTCYILENAPSLESLTVDTIYNSKEDGNVSRCCVEKTGECGIINKDLILEAHKALGCIKRYIVGRVPSSVKLNVGEPCSWCHAM